MILPTDATELNSAMIDFICTELCFADELNYLDETSSYEEEPKSDTPAPKSYVMNTDSRAIA